MSIDIEKARSYIHAHGLLWERALWDYLFDGGSLVRVHQTLLNYKNADGGFGHGLEHDIKCPQSNPLQLEFLFSIIRDTDLPVGRILSGSSEWVASQQQQDGSLKNPKEVLSYPHAPWWGRESEPTMAGGQAAPDSIVGNLIKHGQCSLETANRTKAWVEANVSLDSMAKDEWLFMTYHYFDYFMSVRDFPELDSFQEATIEAINRCAEKHIADGEMAKAMAIFCFVPSPQSFMMAHVPESIIAECLDYLENNQLEDGCWVDEHDLVYWQPYTSIKALLALRNFNRL